MSTTTELSVSSPSTSSSSPSDFIGSSLPPLKGTDTDYAFTRDSILVRLPLIVKETSDRNPELSKEEKEQIYAIATEVANNGVVIPLLSSQPESEWETTYVQPYLGQHYLDIPWFFVENYIYKRILDIVRPHHPTLDPFLSQKMEALYAAGPAFIETVLPLLNEFDSIKTNPDNRSISFRDVLHRSLWGNRADLSMSGGKVHTIEHKKSTVSNDAASNTVIIHEEDLSSLLLWDDTKAIETYLNTLSSTSTNNNIEIMIILDNCGLELLSDLVLVYGLLSLNYCYKITLMSKTSPVFVSDALPIDIERHIQWLETNTLSSTTTTESQWTCSKLASALREYQKSGQLCIENHAFFTSPLPAWEMPKDLRQRLSIVKLAIIKGDANYRRLLGDRHWNHQTPFATAIAYYPCPAVALRTFKGALAVGVSKEGEERARKSNPTDWLVSGKFGVIHYKPKE